ncbi:MULTISPECIES: sulfonate/nitrate/taurine transporter ATP-binding protein [unclassified Romboutsia]|uniref:sulfonate/nitrate/taurine transporter ATP-binding protein n=1 Tax=unclassified Romboutsia TaxID=2626894 RepID=UPI000F050DB9|nr:MULTISPECIES: sulfonate/nitrate/taurine transporter ATP-binding protein [unclassified Romboutsia]
MSDQVAMLSRRPATIKGVYDIDLGIPSEEKTPLKARKAPAFQNYFDILWKELDAYEK